MAVEVIRDVRTIVRLTGEIDFSDLTELEAALDRAVLDAPHGFIVDAYRSCYLDGTVVHAVLRALECMRADGAIALVANAMTREVFHAAELDALPRLILCDGISDAADALSQYTGGTR